VTISYGKRDRSGAKALELHHGAKYGVPFLCWRHCVAFRLEVLGCQRGGQSYAAMGWPVEGFGISTLGIGGESDQPTLVSTRGPDGGRKIFPYRLTAVSFFWVFAELKPRPVILWG